MNKLSQFMPITYTLKFPENQKGNPDEMDLPSLKNDITTN